MKKKYSIKYCLGFVFLFQLFASKIIAQPKENPFDYITVSGAGSYFVADNLQDIGWYSTYGLKLSAEVPFYFGQIGVSINFNPYNSQINLPQMNIYGINLCWGKNISLSESFSVYAGITLGTCFLSFEGNQLTQYERLENELSVGGNTRIIYNLSRQIGFHIALGVNKIFTKNNIRQADIGAGIEYKFSSGKWIKDFLN